MDEGKRLLMAKRIVGAALHNVSSTIAYHAYRGRSELHVPLSIIKQCINESSSAKTVEALMGYEGRARHAYYESWKLIDKRLDFGIRVRRPPNNQINCLISFLNGLTYAIARHEIAKTHLDEGFSFLHAPAHSRASLSLDIAELFKPILADRLIHRIVRKSEISDTWFDIKSNVCLLTENGRREVSVKFSERMDRVAGQTSLRGAIHREAMAIERHLLGIAEYTPFTERL